MTIKFHYFGDTSKAYTNVITIASELNIESADNGIKYPVIRFGYSLSNANDHYKKKLGKQIALNRFHTEPYRLIVCQPDEKPTFNGIIGKMLEHIVNETIVPEWVELVATKYE